MAEPLSGPGLSAEAKEARRLSFGEYAADYDRVRPGWPQPTVAWVIGEPDGPRDVLDLGCGTGKGTRTLVELGHRVVAADPSAGMLDALGSVPELAGVPVVCAPAEQLPLPDAAFDAVACFQAWHWVEPVAAARECARVLRPRGVLGLAWHRPDRSVGWVAELDERAERTDMGAGGEPIVLAGFEPVEQQLFTHEQRLSVDELVAQVSSWSHVAISPRKERILCAVRELGELVAADDGTVTLPYLTDCVRARRP